MSLEGQRAPWLLLMVELHIFLGAKVDDVDTQKGRKEYTVYLCDFNPKKMGQKLHVI